MKKNFSLKERKKIITIHKKERDKRLADRLKLILLLDDGLTYSQVSRVLLLDENTLRRYEKLYKEGGLDLLLNLSYKGSKPSLNERQQSELKEHLSKNVYLSSKKICSYVLSKYGVKYSYQGMAKLLGRLGFVYKKPKIEPGKINYEKQKEFIEKYENLKKNLKKNEKIYFIDSSHPKHNVKQAFGWILKGKNKGKRLKSNSGRDRINLAGALNLQNMEIIVNRYKTIDSEAVVQFFYHVQSKNKNCSKIYLICDNARYFNSTIVNEFLKTSKIKLVFLPSYSPNLNIIERFWKFFYKKVTYNKYYKKFDDFAYAVTGFFRNIHFFKEELLTLLTDKFQTVI